LLDWVVFPFVFIRVHSWFNGIVTALICPSTLPVRIGCHPGFFRLPEPVRRIHPCTFEIFSSPRQTITIASLPILHLCL